MGQGRDRRDRRDRRVVWHSKGEQAQRNRRTLNAQIDGARRVADRSEQLKKHRFAKVAGQTVAFDEELIERARQAAGYKGYVANIAPAVMDEHARRRGHLSRPVEGRAVLSHGQVRPEGAAYLPPPPRLDRSSADHRVHCPCVARHL